MPVPSPRPASDTAVSGSVERISTVDGLSKVASCCQVSDVVAAVVTEVVVTAALELVVSAVVAAAVVVVVCGAVVFASEVVAAALVDAGAEADEAAADVDVAVVAVGPPQAPNTNEAPMSK